MLVDFVDDDRLIVEVAVAWTTVLVTVVVEAWVVVGSSAARTEGARKTASVAMVAAKRIL